MNFKTVEGNGKAVSDTRQVSPFNSITSKCAVQVIITNGNAAPIRIEAEENLLSVIRTNVEDSTLVISTTENIKPTKPFVVYVSSPTFRRLTMEGTGSMTSTNTLTSNVLTLDIAGAGTMKLSLDVDTLLTDLAGAGDFILAGRSVTHIADLNGSGDLTAKDLITQRTAIDIAGTGDAEINVADELEATIEGTGDIHYSGNPKKIRQNIVGMGSIQKR